MGAGRQNRRRRTALSARLNDAVGDSHDADAGPVVQGVLLREELIRLRQQCGFTQKEVARSLEWHPSKVIRIEGGKTPLRKVDLEALLRLYRVDDPGPLNWLRRLHVAARRRGWWDAYKSDVGETYLAYLGFEAGASVIRQFQGLVVPDLLQTAEYAQALDEEHNRRTSSAGPASARVDVLMRRQQGRLARTTPLRCFFVLDEAVIQRLVRNPAGELIMPAQLRHIADTAAGDDLVSVAVLPFGSGDHPGIHQPAFTLLEFAGPLEDLLHLGNHNEGVLLRGENAPIATYRDLFADLIALAYSPADSLQLLRDVADAMDRQQT
ncbi:helix-turn-helix transcriptional regulator [Nonomuraea sp. NPDC049784]|uniref:helix-turn-helix domain-containing protein n=1 Tax=Nonomuraea sp. NPDC049784 TaxID=3154361 RepID=UPI0033EF903D